MGTSITIQQGAINVKQEGKKAAREVTTSRLMETLMRLGYVARGLVYGMIGVLAFQVAMGTGGALDDTQGAIVALGSTSTCVPAVDRSTLPMISAASRVQPVRLA